MSAWQRLTIAGKPADVFDPPGHAPPRFGLLFLHGYDLKTLADNPTWTRLLGELRLACVCPLAGRCWWTDRIWAEFDPLISAERYLLDSIVPFFASRWGLAPRLTGLIGVCMGGQGAMRLALKYPQLFPAVAGIAPAIEYHELYWQGTAIDEMYTSKEQCRQDTAPMHIHPTNFPPHLFFCMDPTDPWARGGERLHEKMAALGVPHEHDLQTRAGGHTWAYYDHFADRTMRFVAAGLERESRRLL
jgi:pimeloyl-ACP methyl ester carboxylesterase